MMNIESHCHSQYSFDSELKIKDIVKQCVKYGIDGVIICDHDVCGINENDERLFKEKGIKLFKAIEFTTSEGVHIVGVSPNIKMLQRRREAYTVLQIVRELKRIGAAIIVPHPDHATGIRGNHNVSFEDIDYAFSNADFVEKYNFQYGKTKDINKLLEKYKNLRVLVGSDAHCQKNVGAVFNRVEETDNMALPFCENTIKEIQHISRLRRTRIYWIKRRIKTSGFYQMVLKLFPVELRREMKNRLYNR